MANLEQVSCSHCGLPYTREIAGPDSFYWHRICDECKPIRDKMRKKYGIKTVAMGTPTSAETYFEKAYKLPGVKHGDKSNN